MKLLYCLLPLMGAVLAQELVEDKCELSCPQVKCATDDPVALCKCINGRETLCKKRCPKYKPQYVPCPISPPTPIATPSPKPTWKPVTCECPLVNCLQVWPGSCYCANTAAQNCYDRCGGAPPKLQECPPLDTVEVREAAPEPKPEAAAAKPACECEQIMCIQMWPDSCYCGNAAAQACYDKCGGKKPVLQTCPPRTTLAISPKPTRKPTPTKTPKPTPTPTLLPPNPHPVCGGGRANYLTCEEGYTCILDPYTPGCGHLCDGLGICVKEKMCGGFAGFPCEEKGQVCHDDPRDECDPKTGGADCGGLCVTPHRPLGS
ncbi:hypothetical protein FB567DRAFT_597612 [Paraphoma chrysanthemicola]|uniref:Uncharacterized protein n=1 Tax=Paraphoma chrysanthemicola TaxID=798071 RepID=A0A8K0QVU5_9PLEO|nr:hypothetical protein FB567DRAFT_597612 [Paraphoma chrysanthemicola]